MTDRKIHVLLLSRDAALRSGMARLDALSGAQCEVVHVDPARHEPGPEEVAELLHDALPGIVVFDFASDPAAGVDFARRLGEVASGSLLIALGPPLASGVLMEAMRSGVTEYLTAPVAVDDVAAAISRAARRLAAAREPAAQRQGRVWALLAAKGGVGTTSAAVNLAVAVRRATQQSTLLVDLDFELGGVALLLGIKPRFSFLEVARNIHRLDPGLLKSYVERHESGLHVLAAPLRPERSDAVAAEEASGILKFLRQLYRYVVLDVSKSLSPMTLTVLQEADVIVAVTTPDLPSLGSLKRVLPVLQRLDNNGSDRLRVVLNRYQADEPVSIDDVRTLLEMNVQWTLRNDYRAVSRAANEGKPVVLNGRSAYAQDIAAMVAGLTNGAARKPAPERANSLGRLLRFGAKA